MNLRDSLSDEHGSPHPAPLCPPLDVRFLVAFVRGWGSAVGAELAVSTDGATMRIHDLKANRRSPKIRRSGWTSVALTQCARLHLERRESWEEESEWWGPDPRINPGGEE